MRVPPEVEKMMLKKLDALQQEYLWISANEKKLKRTHLNKYIAVKGKKIVFESDDCEALLKVILASHREVDSFALKRVTKEPPCLLL